MSFSKFISICILLSICAYTYLIFNPQALFGVKHNSGPLLIYSQVPVELSASEIIVRAREKAALSDYYSADQAINVFLVGNENKYKFLAPFCGSYSCLNPLTGNILIALPNLEKNLAADTAGGAPRVLESVITHELVKAGMLRKFLFLSYVFMPPLKVDGYAEHVTMEAANMDKAEICPGKKDNLVATYLRHRLVLEYIVQSDNTTFPELLRSDKGSDTSIQQAMKKYCSQN